ncbi:unnamed protein product [Camellia sinensis]
MHHICFFAHAKVESVKSKEAAEQRMLKKKGWFPFRWSSEIVYSGRLAANGGFQGRPNKPSGTCYAFWVGGVLRILGGHKFINEKALHQFLLTCQSQPYLDHNQFTGRIPDAFYKHTFLKEMYIEGNAFRPGVNPIGIHNVQHYVNGQVVIESAGDTLESCSKAQTDSYQEEVAVA